MASINADCVRRGNETNHMSTSTGGHGSPTSKKARRTINHETSDVQTRPLWIFLILMLVSVILSMLFVGGFIALLGPTTRNGTTAVGPAAPAAPTPRLPPETSPRLQGNPRAEEDRLILEQQQRLNSYGVDAETGTIHIPIDDAIRLTLERGLPDAGTTEP
jgi:hypothetical protein